jgi:NAD(P)-dependent dehydrogenase (short-subunit alcohol dehydrogenase family)
MAQDRTVVITGAGGGIGRAMAIGFTAGGASVVGLGRTDGPLAETAALCGGGAFEAKVADVSDASATQAAIAEVLSERGAVDILICNAAVYPRAFFVDQSAEEWNRTLMINVCGVANCCRAVLPSMLERGRGRIVVIGSLADMNPVPASSAYSASKAALHCLVKALAAEIDPKRFPDVLVNEFNPSATRTSMSEQGDDPALVFARVKGLADLPAGGPSGRMFFRDKELRPPESLRSKVRRTLSRVLRGG